MRVELDIEAGDVLKFNDEVWKVEEQQPHDNTLDLYSVDTGRLNNFTMEELEKQIDFTGHFHRIKGDYVGIE